MVQNTVTAHVPNPRYNILTRKFPVDGVHSFKQLPFTSCSYITISHLTVFSVPLLMHSPHFTILLDGIDVSSTLRDDPTCRLPLEVPRSDAS